MKIVLISTYELGRQPFGLASPAAWLRKRGHEVTCLDLSREPLNEEAIREAGLMAFYVPMHTATRLTLELLEPVRRINPTAHLCAYGLYASLSADILRAQGIGSLLGGEFEQALVDLAEHLSGLVCPAADSSVGFECLVEPIAVSGAGPFRAAAAAFLRAPGASFRGASCGGLHGSEPRM